MKETKEQEAKRTEPRTDPKNYGQKQQHFETRNMSSIHNGRTPRFLEAQIKMDDGCCLPKKAATTHAHPPCSCTKGQSDSDLAFPAGHCSFTLDPSIVYELFFVVR